MLTFLCDTATKLTAKHRGAVIVCGSHGGIYAGQLAAKAGVRAVIFSDAGIGMDGAGIGSLAYGAALGMAVVTVAHDSARIGDAKDMLRRGRISRVNAIARAIGCAEGMSCEAAADALSRAPSPTSGVPPMTESRHVLGEADDGPRVVLIDSASLVQPEDAGQIVVTASHGGLVGSDPRMALRVDAYAACFHDAGIGIDEAGISRLPALDQRGIAAMTVAAESARIGDALSLYDTGRISCLNNRASALGVVLGQSLREAVARLRAEAGAEALQASA